MAIGVGAMVMRGAGCTYNDIVDRDFDAKVERTRTRPIPSGQVSVRQAIAFAVDKQEIVDVALFGPGVPATGPYVPNTWPYNPNVKKYEYNPEQARQLLMDAGWKDTDGDGILDKDGRQFRSTILTNMGNSLRKNTATIIQWRLGMIGIKVDIRALEWSRNVCRPSAASR